ncbi:MAG: hypothetical protein ACPF9D_13235, partial [Owenweeksia sp.]
MLKHNAIPLKLMNTKAPILVLFLISCLTLTGQKVRLKGDTSRFLCKSDSLYHYFVKDLVDQDVDGMVTVQYDYDNGRVESAKTFILWMKDSLRQMKSFQGCDTIRDNGTLNFPVQKVFDLYRKYQVDTVTTRRIKSRLWVSHSMGYFVKVFLAGKT